MGEHQVKLEETVSAINQGRVGRIITEMGTVNLQIDGISSFKNSAISGAIYNTKDDVKITVGPPDIKASFSPSL